MLRDQICTGHLKGAFLTNNETDKRRNLLFVLLHLFLWKVQTDVPRRNANQKRLLAG